MSIADEARAEAERLNRLGMLDATDPVGVFTQGWLASRKPEAAPSARECPVCHRVGGTHKMDCHPQNRIDAEAAPSDTDDEYQPNELAAALNRGSQWLYASVHKSRGCTGCDICTLRSMMEIAAERLSRTSQPVQVEVTDEMRTLIKDARKHVQWLARAEIETTSEVLLWKMADALAALGGGE